ncbi:MAG TPA: hypothetical protein VMK65_08945 [Longimicrobiales bacterium]|nr:hypothetical protein [Longimicrobiales bacterium]
MSVLLAACAAEPPPPPAEPAPMPGMAIEYAVPPGGVLTYAMADTVTLTFGAGVLANMRIEGGYHATVRTSWEPADGAFLVRARVEDFSGELRNPMAGNTRSTEEDVQGEWVVLLTTRGTSELLEAPSVSRAFRDVVGTNDLLRNAFLRLPPEPVRRGDSWTDTIRVEERGSDQVETSTTVVTSTWAGDSVIGERTLWIIRSTTETTLRIESVSDGTEVVQSLEGGTDAETLFDPERGLIVSADERGLLTGTLDVPDAGLTQVPLTARVRRHMALRRNE